MQRVPEKDARFGLGFQLVAIVGFDLRVTKATKGTELEVVRLGLEELRLG